MLTESTFKTSNSLLRKDMGQLFKIDAPLS